MTLLEHIVKLIANSPKGSMSESELARALEMPQHMIHPTIVMMHHRGLVHSLLVDWGCGCELKRVYRLTKEVRENYERTRPTR